MVPFVSQQLNNLDLALAMARRGNLPGAEGLVAQQFERMFAAGQYKEAAEVAAESPQGLLRTKEVRAWGFAGWTLGGRQHGATWLLIRGRQQRPRAARVGCSRGQLPCLCLLRRRRACISALQLAMVPAVPPAPLIAADARACLRFLTARWSSASRRCRRRPARSRRSWCTWACCCSAASSTPWRARSWRGEAHGRLQRGAAGAPVAGGGGGDWVPLRNTPGLAPWVGFGSRQCVRQEGRCQPAGVDLPASQGY